MGKLHDPDAIEGGSTASLDVRRDTAKPAPGQASSAKPMKSDPDSGRPMESNAPSGMGAASISGATEAVQSEAGRRRPGGESSTDGARQTDRPPDVVEGRADF